jgi:hypothetical protein
VSFQPFSVIATSFNQFVVQREKKSAVQLHQRLKQKNATSTNCASMRPKDKFVPLSNRAENKNERRHGGARECVVIKSQISIFSIHLNSRLILRTVVMEHAEAKGGKGKKELHEASGFALD